MMFRPEDCDSLKAKTTRRSTVIQWLLYLWRALGTLLITCAADDNMAEVFLKMREECSVCGGV